MCKAAMVDFEVGVGQGEKPLLVAIWGKFIHVAQIFILVFKTQ